MLVKGGQASTLVPTDLPLPQHLTIRSGTLDAKKMPQDIRNSPDHVILTKLLVYLWHSIPFSNLHLHVQIPAGGAGVPGNA